MDWSGCVIGAALLLFLFPSGIFGPIFCGGEKCGSEKTNLQSFGPLHVVLLLQELVASCVGPCFC